MKFLEGEKSIRNPQRFRVILDRQHEYYGADIDGFVDRDKYICYQVAVPYGSVDEFSKYAFVEKDTPLAEKLDKDIPLGENPLAVTIGLEFTTIGDGTDRLIITEYVTPGWFAN